MSSIFESAVLESAGKSKVKNFSDTFLYGMGDYEKNLFSYIMHATRIPKDNKIFEDLKLDIKKQRTSEFLLKVLLSDKTVLCYNEKALPRAFKVFCAKDVKDNGQLKVFIDVTGIITGELDNLNYTYGNIPIIISYLMSGAFSMIYYADPTKYFNKTSLVTSGTKCFSSLVYHIIDYLRIGADNNKSKIKYMAAKYFQLCIMNRPETESVENISKRISGISETEINIIELHTEGIDIFKNIDTFVKGLSKVLKADRLTTDVFIDKWMYNYGMGMQFACELFPSFVTMMVYAYVGAYLNNQKTIEKIVGRDMVDFIQELNKLGNEVIK